MKAKVDYPDGDVSEWVRCVKCDELKPEHFFNERGWDDGPVCDECLGKEVKQDGKK